MAQVSQHAPSPIQTTDISDSPPVSSTSSPSRSPLSSKRPRSPLSLDLNSLPPLSQPAPPSNTLLITRLDDSKIFHPASLATIRQHINGIAPLNSFSPLKSMNRIIVSFFTTEECISVRQSIDGTAFLGSAVAKCYFGEPTPVGDDKKKYLDRPDAGRLFFISPPPSPPIGWEMRHEDPPNKEVHAEDLAAKLEKLTGKMESRTAGDDSSPAEEQRQYTAEELHKLKTTRAQALASVAEQDAVASPTTGSSPKKLRSRSSTLIYDPKVHGDSPALPAVMLETEDDSEVELDTGASKTVKAHTARPPVELMDQ